MLTTSPEVFPQFSVEQLARDAARLAAHHVDLDLAEAIRIVQRAFLDTVMHAIGVAATSGWAMFRN